MTLRQRRQRWLLASLVAVAAGCSSEGVVDPDSLAAKVIEETARRRPVELEEGSPLAGLKDRHFLFVGGFLNEAIPGYFTDNARVTHDEFGAGTSLLFPSSGRSLSDDADQIRARALELYALGSKPVVLVGHSKGGAGVLLAAVRYPELVLGGKVDCVIAIQGAIKGSPVADTIAFTHSSSILPFRFRGLESLTTRESRSIFATELAKLRTRHTPEEVTTLFERVFYVRSCERRVLHVATELQPTHALLLLSGSGHNDGMLLEEHMKLDDLGVDLGVVPGDHAALTVSGFLSTSSREEREAFTRALYREVFTRLERTPLPGAK